MDAPLFHFRAALALNNMAVTMMQQHGSHDQAYSALKNAVFAMKSALRPTEQREDIAQMLQQAYHASACRSETNTPRRLPLRTVSHNTRFEATGFVCFEKVGAPGNYGADLSPFTLIRVDTEFTDLETEFDDSGLFAFILLYNFGIAHVCRATSPGIRPSVAGKLEQQGIKLLMRCREFYETQFESCEDVFLLPQIIFLFKTTVEALVQVFTRMGESEEARFQTSVLSWVHNAAMELFRGQHYVQAKVAVAPAA